MQYLATHNNIQIYHLPYVMADRDFVLCKFADNTVQPFYRSTGRNSGMPGTWLPFDGIVIVGGRLWFNKRRFRDRDDPQYHRYGTQYYKEISMYLGQLNIQPATLETENHNIINQFLELDKLALL